MGRKGGASPIVKKILSYSLRAARGASSRESFDVLGSFLPFLSSSSFLPVKQRFKPSDCSSLGVPVLAWPPPLIG
jgi:hypothetical protein